MTKKSLEGLGKMAQCVRGWICKRKVLSSSPRAPVKNLGGWCVFVILAWLGDRDRWTPGALASHLT